MFRFAFQTLDAFELLITGHSHFLLSKHLLLFSNVLFTLTSAGSSNGFVEQTFGSNFEFFLSFRNLNVL